MSHLVTVTKTTTNTTNSSYVVLYTGYLKTFPGILKTFELLINAACVGILIHYFHRGVIADTPTMFFFLMVTAFLIGTFCLLLSCITSLNTGAVISKTSYELIYHSIAGILLLISSSLFLIGLNNSYRRYEHYDPFLAASIMGLVNCVLYFISAYLAHRSYHNI